MLALDAGNSLFQEFYASDEPLRAKADLIVRAMAGMGVKVMGVGMRDLSAGPEFVQKLGAKHGVKPLSANLMKDGKRIFAPSAILTVHGVKVGVIGASPPNPFKFPGVEGKPLVETVIPEAKRLRGQVDVVVVLAAVMYPDAMQLAKEGGGVIDFVLQNHDMRGVGPGVPIEVEKNHLIHTGERGRQIARLDLVLSGPGPFADALESTQRQKTLEVLDRQIGQVKKRLETANDEKARASYAQTLQSFEQRRQQLAEQAAQLADPQKRVTLSYPVLGPEVASDPELARQVAKLEPPKAH